MKIITDSSNSVVYAGENLELTESYARKDDKYDYRLTTSNASIFTVDDIPEYFLGRCYTYTEADGFTVTAPDKLTQVRRDKSPETDLLDEVDIDTYVDSCTEAELRDIIKTLYKEMRNAKR